MSKDNKIKKIKLINTYYVDFIKHSSSWHADIFETIKKSEKENNKKLCDLEVNIEQSRLFQDKVRSYLISFVIEPSLKLPENKDIVEKYGDKFDNFPITLGREYITEAERICINDQKEQKKPESLDKPYTMVLTRPIQIEVSENNEKSIKEFKELTFYFKNIGVLKEILGLEESTSIKKIFELSVQCGEVYPPLIWESLSIIDGSFFRMEIAPFLLRTLGAGSDL